jgi:hypothetical protein
LTTSSVLDLLRRYCCDNQQMLSQYSFVVGEKHKALENSLRCWSELITTEEIIKKSTPPSVEHEHFAQTRKNVEKHLLDLENYLTVSFSEVCSQTFKYALEYFELRSKVRPRVAVKVIVDQELAILCRSPELPEGQDFKVSINENSAFVKISEGSKYFLCNNIPECIEKGTYFNNKLIKPKVLQYNLEKQKITTLGGDYQKVLDDLWQQCWEKDDINGVSTIRDMEACYRSSLVIPMSLRTSPLAEEFALHFQIDKTSKMGEIKRLVFGFLCFDHQHQDFFDEENDVNFTYIMADILSLYLIQRLSYTQYSPVYGDSIAILD